MGEILKPTTANPFLIEGRATAKNAGDIQRNWTWYFSLNDSNILEKIGLGEDAFMVRCRSMSIPQRGNGDIISHFMGFEQHFAGKPTFGNSVTIEFEEFQGLELTQALYNWKELMTSTNTGVSRAFEKRGNSGYATSFYAIPFAYDGTNYGKKVKFINAWPETIPEVALSYESESSIKYSVTFKFDYWQWVDNADKNIQTL